MAAFGVCNTKRIYNAAAVLEWAVAFIFTFYVFSFLIDLLPAVHTKHYASNQTAMEVEMNDGPSSSRRGQRGHKINGAANGFPNGQYVQSGYDRPPARY